MNLREELQVFTRRLGLLNATCCDECCGEQVSIVQSHILFEVRRMDGPTMQRVADELGIDITTFSRQIKNLEARGLINRQVSPADRRVNILGLTESGSRILGNIDQYMTQNIERIFSSLTPFEREVITRSLGLLNEAMTRNGCCSQRC